MLAIPAHRAYATAMTEDDPLAAEESERLKVALREMDGKMGHAVHYGLGEASICGVDSVGIHWADEPESVAGCADCLELAAEDLADGKEYQGRCLDYRLVSTARGGVQCRRAVRRSCSHCGRQGWQRGSAVDDTSPCTVADPTVFEPTPGPKVELAPRPRTDIQTPYRSRQ